MSRKRTDCNFIEKSQLVKFSLSIFSGRSWPETLELCKLLDNENWYSLYISDHVMRELTHPGGSDIAECWTSLAAIAASTSKVNIGPLVSSVSMRHPAIIAKMAANINAISNGRLILGLGSGWDKTEHDAYGIPMLSIEERTDMFEESLIVINGLLKNDVFSYEGKYFNINNGECTPNINNNKIPIMVGSWKGNEKIIKHAQNYADSLNLIYPLYKLKNINLNEISINKSVHTPIIYIDEYSKKILQKYKELIPKDKYVLCNNPDTIKKEFSNFNEVIIGDFSFITDQDDLMDLLMYFNNTFNSILDS